LNRHDRRALAKKSGFSRKAAVNSPPSSRRPAILTFWRRAPEEVFAHIFTHCRVLFEEWAGRDLGYPENRKWYTAFRRLPGTKGICPACIVRYRVEARG
jgi:hypothetical protein